MEKTFQKGYKVQLFPASLMKIVKMTDRSGRKQASCQCQVKRVVPIAMVSSLDYR